MRVLFFLLLMAGVALVDIVAMLGLCNLLGWTTLDTSYLLPLLFVGIGMMVLSMIALSYIQHPKPGSPS